MFHFLGISVLRAWPIWLAGWLALLAAAVETAPPWEKVVRDREFAFLPEDAPSRQGGKLLRRAFPADRGVSNIVIVASRPDEELNDADRVFIKDVVKPALVGLADEEGGLASHPKYAGAEPIVADIKTLDDKQTGALLVSADRQATVVIVDLTTELLEARNWPVMAEIEGLIAGWKQGELVPAGLDLNLIGSAAVGRDMTVDQQQSTRAIEFWTVILVIVMLLAIYRAPLLALIPLASVAMATQLSLKLLTYLAEARVIELFVGVEIYITVILYGTGVDYCLFLISRYQEEREKGADWDRALESAIGHVGPALLASAFTVIFGIGMMVFARFGKFHNAGIAVAFSLVVGLCVVLTFTTSLLRMTGSWAFWPRHPAPPTDSHVAFPRGGWLRRAVAWFSWETLGQALMRRPVLIWFSTVLVLSPLVVGGILYVDHVDYDFIRRLPPDAPSVAGTDALNAHFAAGAVGTATVLLYCPDCDFELEDGKDVIELETLTDYLKADRTQLQLADVRSLTRPLGITLAARQAYDVPVDQIPKQKQQAMHFYVSDAGDLKGKVTRLELTMMLNPLSRPGIAWLNEMEETIRSELPGHLRNAKVYMVGTTADMRDLRRVTGSDQTRIQVLAVLSVLTILIVLLRRVGVSLYLIASVMFSYFATLGAAQALFWWLDPAGFTGLDWKVPIFLFTILVAVGEDYNIFLMTRVAEEQKEHGLVEGVRVAVVKTGRIITSCGIIMAGTFATLLSGSMQDLQHLGFALGFGVLMDTFVVRPILVPTFLIVVERGRLFWTKLSALVEAAPQSDPAERKLG